jgi:thiosulfate dehydrogenase (quinone) large subunit
MGAALGTDAVMPAVERRPLATWVALIRVLCGLIWGVDAWLKWQPDYIGGFKDAVAEGAKHQAAFLKPWFDFWIQLTALNPPALAYGTAVLETLIAISLLFGLARRPMYIVGFAYSLLIWATAEGFGGPYTAGATDLGTAITYAVVFALLFLVDDLAGRSSFAIDNWIERRVPWWNRIARTPGATA